MVDIGAEDRIDLDAIPELRSGLHLLGGEPRARHLYAEPGASGDVLAAWREVLGDRAWVLSRDEAIKEGWFGPVDARMADRIGDVVAAPVGTWRSSPRRRSRGSPPWWACTARSAADQLVPALTFTAARDRPQQPSACLAAALAGWPAAPGAALLDLRWRLGGPPGIGSYSKGTCPARSSSTSTATCPAGRSRRTASAARPGIFTDAMRAAGVSEDRPVVVYDDRDAMPAARAWWLLCYHGHQNVRVLDGGYRAWLAAGLPVTRPIRRRSPATSPRGPATCRCWTPRARRTWRGPGCCSTRGRGSGTGESTSPSTRWRVTSPARSARRPPAT